MQETIKYSDKIYDARVTRRLTLREVTKDLNLRGLKITAIELSEIETDRANPTEEQKKAINEYYQLDVKKSLTLKYVETEEGIISESFENTGFNVFEIMGMLFTKNLDIYDTLKKKKGDN